MNLEARKLNLINWISSIQEGKLSVKLKRSKRKKPIGGIRSVGKIKRPLRKDSISLIGANLLPVIR